MGESWEGWASSISFAVARGEKWLVVAKQKGGPGRGEEEGGGYYHSGAEAYITRPPLSFLTGISAKLSPLLPRREESRGGDETRARVWHPAGARHRAPGGQRRA